MKKKGLEMNSSRMPEHSPTRDKGDFPRDFHGHKKVGTSSFPPCFLSFQAEAPHRPAPYNVRNANATFGELKKTCLPFLSDRTSEEGEIILLPLFISREGNGDILFLLLFLLRTSK